MNNLEESFAKSQFRPTRKLFLTAILLVIGLYFLTNIELDSTRKATEKQFKGMPLAELEDRSTYDHLYLGFIPDEEFTHPTPNGIHILRVKKKGTKVWKYAEFHSQQTRDGDGNHITVIPSPFLYQKEWEGSKKHGQWIDKFISEPEKLPLF